MQVGEWSLDVKTSSYKENIQIFVTSQGNISQDQIKVKTSVGTSKVNFSGKYM